MDREAQIRRLILQQRSKSAVTPPGMPQQVAPGQPFQGYPKPQQQQQQHPGLNSQQMAQSPPQQQTMMSSQQMPMQQAQAVQQQQPQLAQIQQQQQGAAPVNMAAAQMMNKATAAQQHAVAMAQQQARMREAQQRDGSANSAPHQYIAQIADKYRQEREHRLGNAAAYEKSKKRPLENEQRHFWAEPLPARLVAGLSLLESDNCVTAGHHLGGASDLWAFLDPMPSPSTCGNPTVSRLRVGGADAYKAGQGIVQHVPQEYMYAECSLSGLIDMEDSSNNLSNVCHMLSNLCDVQQKGLWKDECWRVKVDDEGAPIFLQSSLKCAKEIWIRRYLLPTHLQYVFATRIYSPQHLAVPPQFPTNARLVKEATCSPSIVSLLDGIGFERCPPNDVYVKAVLYHIDAGTPRHVIVVISKIYTNRYLSEEMFPNKLFIEAKARSEKPSMMNTLATTLTEIAHRLAPHVSLLKA